MDLASRLAALVVGTPLVAVAALLAIAPPRVDLVVVNGTGAPVVVTVGGRPPARLEAGAELALEGLAAGRTRLAARVADVADCSAQPRASVGSSVDELTGDLVAGLGAPRPTYVWDVAAATSFVVATWGYGDRTGERGVEPFALAGRRLFALPAAFVPGVDAAFPDKARVPSGAKGTTRRALWTRAHADRAGKAEVVLVVDDAVGSNVRVEVDGVVQAVVRGGQAISLTGLLPGRHSLRAVELRVDGSETGRVHALEADLEAAPFSPAVGWVWNVAGAQREYRVVSRVYGGPADQPSPPTTTMTAPGELFRLPGDFYPGINSAHPERWRAGVLKMLWTPLAYGLITGPMGATSESAGKGIEDVIPGFGEKKPAEAPAPR